MSKDYYTITNKEDDSQQLVDHKKAWENVTGVIHSEENESVKQSAMGDFLQGIRSEIRSQNMSKETFSAYGTGYRDVYTEKERKKQASKKGTELWRKNLNAEFIEEQEKKRQEKMRSRAVAAIQKAGIRADIISPDTSALSAFMGNSTKENVALLKAYRGAEKSRAILACMKKFMKLDVENLDIRSNNKVAENAEKLERLNEMFSGVQYLITKSPDIYAGLPENIRLSFEKHYGKANTVVTYYRLKKQVMLDSYFRTHENREIGTETSKDLSPEQMNLTEMIWQSAGGLAIFLNKSNDYLVNGTLKSLKESLRQKGVSKDRLALQAKLRKRREELEKKGLADRMDEFLIRERILDVKGKLNIIGHARNLKTLAFTGDPQKDVALLPYLLDQREVIEQTQDMRKNSKTSYYMEQSDKQVTVADTAIDMLDTVRRLEEDLLTMGQLTKGGGVDTSVTKERIKLCRERYNRDFTEYREKMAALRAARLATFRIQAEDSPEQAEYKPPENRESNPLKEAKELIATLTYHKFSDVEIYNARNSICALSKKCKDTEASEVLDILAKRAVVVWERKRLLNVQAALKRDKNNQALKDEEKRLLNSEKLRNKYKDENGNTVEGKDESMDGLLRLRAEAAEKLFDFNDLKAQAVHYTDQYEWALNAKNEGSGFLLWLGSPVLNRLFKHFGSDRNKVHGEEKYAESVERLERLPQEIRDHQEGAGFTLQRGDESVPPVDIADLYEDRTKDDLKTRIKGVRDLLDGHEAEYPEEIRTAVEAMEHYVKIKYIVTTDTTEMEMAFLDKFQKDMQRALKKIRNISFEDNVISGLLDISNDIHSMGRGKLRDADNPERITDAEFAAAVEQTAVFNMYSKDDLNESNVKDIPLFLHKSNINDVKQGYIGDCYFLSAITAYMRTNPEGIMNMFHDIGDGNVLVRLYMGFDKNNRRVDTEEEMVLPEVEMRPVYIKVRKDYDISATAQDCMWVQLLEKAYASTGTMHRSANVDSKTGEIKDLACEIAKGTPQKAMMHLTGRKDCWEISKPEPEKYQLNEEDEINRRRKRQLFSGVPIWLHEIIWDSIPKDQSADLNQEDEWINTILEAVKNRVREDNENRKEHFASLKAQVLSDIKSAKAEDLDVIEKKIMEVYTLDPDAIAAQVMKNILTESPDMGDGTDKEEPSVVISRLYDQFNAEEPLERILSGIGAKITYYDKPKVYMGETEEQYKSRLDVMNLYAKNRNKAMMEMNPEGYYSREEMIFLHDVRAAKKRKEGMTFGVFMHAMDVLDVKLKNNRWFILVRDTNNVRNYTYEKDAEGNLIGTAGKSSSAKKREIRSLDGNLVTGVLGTPGGN